MHQMLIHHQTAGQLADVGKKIGKVE